MSTPATLFADVSKRQRPKPLRSSGLYQHLSAQSSQNLTQQ